MFGAAVALMAATLTACGGGATPAESTPEPTAAAVAETPAAEATKAESTQTESTSTETQTTTTTTQYDKEGTVTASGLRFIELTPGSGENPKPGDIVSVHYTGTLTDGTKFDSSVDRGKPIEFRIGKGQVIPGWDEGIAMLKPGGKARLVIPPQLGYGERGAGADIPPNATLIFEVELVSVKPGPPGAPKAPTEVKEADYTKTATGLKYYDMVVGEGDLAEAGKKVSVNYTGWMTDSKMFDSSLERGVPFDFVLGRKQVIPGWDEGVTGMKVGGKRQLIIPSELAYGDKGAGGVIPPKATLIFEVELLGVKEGPVGAPAAPTEVKASDYLTTTSGLKYYDMKVGTGASPKQGQSVTVNYTGWLTDGTKFDSSLDRGDPFTFPIGAGQVIPGWDEGVMSMKIGGKRQLVIPSNLAYGAAGAGGVIPPNASLIFEVELLEAK
jgi:peptidylprolyl isomerase